MAAKQTKTPRAPKSAPQPSSSKPSATKSSRARKPRAAAAAAPSRFSFATYAIGAASVAAGALLTAFVARTLSARRGSAEHVPTDLLGDKRPAPTDRAPDAFRPDPTAPVPAGEREGLRPATGPAPSLVNG